MSRRDMPSLHELADEVLAVVNDTAQTKEASLAAEKVASKVASASHLGNMLRTAALELRNTPAEVTDADVIAYLNGRRR